MKADVNRVLAVALLAGVLAVAADLVRAAPAQPDVTLDPALVDRQRALLLTVVRTRDCLRAAVRAVVRHGVVQGDVVRDFARSLCTPPVMQQMLRDGVPYATAAAAVDQMVERAVREDAPDPAQPQPFIIR